MLRPSAASLTHRVFEITRGVTNLLSEVYQKMIDERHWTRLFIEMGLVYNVYLFTLFLCFRFFLRIYWGRRWGQLPPILRPPARNSSPTGGGGGP